VDSTAVNFDSLPEISQQQQNNGKNKGQPA
jgi:hypothetical protein